MRRLHPAGLLAVGLLTTVLAACETTPAAQPRPGPAPTARPTPPRPPSGPTPFRAADFAWSTGKGPGGISGVVNYRAGSGERWTCSGQTVGLTPDTPHSAERIAKLYGSSERAVQSVAQVLERSSTAGRAEYGQYLRDTACEAGDNFNFRELPDGSYFLIVRVHPPAGAGPTDLVIMQRVAVRGSVVRLTLPPNAAPPPPPPPPARAPARRNR